MRRLWAPANDVRLPNIDRQSFKGTDPCISSNPFTREPHLNRLVTISTGQTINPGLDIAPTGRYQIYQDPRATSEDWTLNLLGVYKPDGKAVRTIFIQNPDCASCMGNT